MKKVFTLIAVMLLMATSVFAQKLSYQAVVRNSANELVPTTELTVDVSIFGATGDVLYTESQTTTSNQNGLITLQIGNESDAWNAINWEGATIQSVIKQNGTTIATITSPVNAVPLALQALNANSGSFEQVQSDWNQTLENEPDFIKNKPENLVTTEMLSNELNNLPTVNDGNLSVQVGNNNPVQIFSANAANDAVIRIPEIPEIPTVNDGKLSVQVGNNNPVQIFSANAANDAVIRIPEVPTMDEIEEVVSEMIPTVYDDTLFVYYGNEKLATFTANQKDGNQTVVIPEPVIPDISNLDQTYVRKDEVDNYIQTYLNNNLATYLSNYLDQFAIQSSSEVFDVAEEGVYEFELTMVPMDNTVVMFYVNGVMVGTNNSGVISIDGTTVTYNANGNYSYDLQAGDKVTIVYIHPVMH